MSISGPSCSFCNRLSSEVGKVITGGTANICDECVETCHSILRKEGIAYADKPPVIENALLRCFRKDSAAHPLFEQVRDDLDLWVWELGPALESSWEEGIQNTMALIAGQLPFLSTLRNGSEGFTLHLATSCRGIAYIFVIPDQLMRIASDIGFAIELQVDRS